MTDQTTHVDTLIKAAANTESPDMAMKFSQAALNVANAISTLDYNSRANSLEGRNANQKTI